ncbi:MAG: alpha/beta hydrolase [Bacteroidota bacterium]
MWAQTTPAPDLQDEHYGPESKNTFDLWKARAEAPAPLVVLIHGGGFSSGSKKDVSRKLIGALLGKGMSVMTIDYRLTPEAVFPQHYQDCVRAIQYARFHAQELNIDSTRIGAGGSSAGACTAMWIGFHDDMADPASADPVLRMSTRLSCVAEFSGQTTLEPDLVKEWIGDFALKHSFFKGAFFGLKEEDLKGSHTHDLFRQASPMAYLTPDDPPVWAYYSGSKDPPVNLSEAVHHYSFGVHLKERMDSLDIPCVLLQGESGKPVNGNCAEFFVQYLRDKP